MSAFLKIDLLTDIAALCLTDFIDWRYIHSLVGIFDPACELLPPWTKELYLCTVAPLSSLWPPPPPSQTKCTVYTDRVCLRGGGWIVLCRPYSAGILHSVSYQMQNLPNYFFFFFFFFWGGGIFSIFFRTNYFTTPNKMTSENDIKGLVSIKFLRPCEKE